MPIPTFNAMLAAIVEANRLNQAPMYTVFYNRNMHANESTKDETLYLSLCHWYRLDPALFRTASIVDRMKHNLGEAAIIAEQYLLENEIHGWGQEDVEEAVRGREDWIALQSNFAQGRYWGSLLNIQTLNLLHKVKTLRETLLDWRRRGEAEPNETYCVVCCLLWLGGVNGETYRGDARAYLLQLNCPSRDYRWETGFVPTYVRFYDNIELACGIYPTELHRILQDENRERLLEGQLDEAEEMGGENENRMVLHLGIVLSRLL
ncbi:hypothetical protein P7C73_g3856, partial [Tremellales sp. Uapishka_1]